MAGKHQHGRTGLNPGFCVWILLPFFVLPRTLTAQDTKLTIAFQFAGVVEGYENICKTQIWLGDALLGESKEVKETEGGSFEVVVPPGEHVIRVLNLAKYDGAWEEHTLANEYSIDARWEGSHHFTGKAETLYILFDAASSTKMSWKKMPKGCCP